MDEPEWHLERAILKQDYEMAAIIRDYIAERTPDERFMDYVNKYKWRNQI